jgi:hypothetical protein
MTELTATPGATEITLPPATRETLMADPAFHERVKNGDATAREQYLEAWRVEHGLPAKPAPAVNTVDVLTQMAGRALAETESQAEDLRALGFTEVAIYGLFRGGAEMGQPIALESVGGRRALAGKFRVIKFVRHLLFSLLWFSAGMSIFPRSNLGLKCPVRRVGNDGHRDVNVGQAPIAERGRVFVGKTLPECLVGLQGRQPTLCVLMLGQRDRPPVDVLHDPAHAKALGLPEPQRLGQ